MFLSIWDIICIGTIKIEIGSLIKRYFKHYLTGVVGNKTADRGQINAGVLRSRC